MSEIPRTIAAQGGEYSYHGLAARAIFGASVNIEDCPDFPAVIRASRADGPGGAGVIAIRSAFGTIDRSAAQIVRARPSALPTITGRFDAEVSLVLAAACELELKDINSDMTKRMNVHAQKEAWEQCETRLQQLVRRPKRIRSAESTKAIRDIVAMQKPEHLAIGPAHAVEPLGAHQVGDEQLNPAGSITRFYALQRDPELKLFYRAPEQTTTRTVVSLAHPESPGEMEKVLELFRDMDLVPADFINFAIGDNTTHRKDQKRAGGIFEIVADRYSAELLEFIARVDGLHGNDGAHGPFSAKALGAFDWYPEQPMDLDAFANSYDSQPSVTSAANGHTES
jgi:prephenate dehydratase